MATLYLHIGMHKTGTTAIQHFMAKNRNTLEKHGAVYPDFGLRYEWVNVNRNAHWLTKGGFSEETAPKCFEMVNQLADTYSKIILSDEGLWSTRGKDPAFWEYLQKNLRDEIKIKVIICIRRQDQYVYSYWAEQVKAQQAIDFKTFTFQEYLDAGLYRSFPLDFEKYFKPLLPILGKENIIIRIFEKEEFKGGSIYADFMDALGLELDDSYVIPANQNNLSIKGNVLEAKRRLNYIPEFSEQGNRVLKYLFEAQEELEAQDKLVIRTEFPREERIKFLEHYKKSNEWTARNILGREDGRLFNESIPEDLPASEPYAYEEITDAYGFMMLAMLREIHKLQDKLAASQDRNKELRKKAQKKPGKDGSDSLLVRAKRKLRG